MSQRRRSRACSVMATRSWWPDGCCVDQVQAPDAQPRSVFTDFFFLLRFYGVPVTVTEWLALMRGLALGLVPCGLDQFYAVARGILVKSEAYFDQYDQAFAGVFDGHRDAG